MYAKNLRLFAALIALVLLLTYCFSALAYDTIPFGEDSTQVSNLQRALKSKGYYKGKVDGVFGQKTRSAVYRYQKAIGITADGKAGNKTLTALYDGLSAANKIDGAKAAAVVTKNKKTLYYGCEGASVSSVQRLLRKAGYFKGSVDGKFGDLTVIAVKRFQWAHNLHGDGLVGKKTLASLKAAVSN